MESELAMYLTKGAREIGIIIDKEKVEQFISYYYLLIEENKKYNLTSIVNERDVALKHFVDSMACVNVYNFSGKKVADIGTGAGFPGIPLKILNRDMKLLLTDSVSKKIAFVRKVVERLGLEEVEMLQERAEDIGRQEKYREKFDLVVSRAVASMNVLLEYCLPLVKPGGSFLAMKGPGVGEEILNAGNALEKLGGKIIESRQIRLPISGDERNLVMVKKITPTPAPYPRRAGIPAKRPL